MLNIIINREQGVYLIINYKEGSNDVKNEIIKEKSKK